MLSTAGGEEESFNYNNNTTSSAQGRRNRVIQLSSLSPSPSPSPFSPLALLPDARPRTKTMEEVWQDISLASLHDRSDPTRNVNFRGLTFQDFLSRPPGKNPQPPATVPLVYSSPASPPVTALSLISGPDQFALLRHSDPTRTNPLHQTQPFSSESSCVDVSFEDLAASPSMLPGVGTKRFPEDDGSSGDRRQKRMIKNRESAARSRARKQELAYTNELELEVAHLMEENARLKKQQQQLCLAAAAQVPKRNTLHRTSTAPF